MERKLARVVFILLGGLAFLLLAGGLLHLFTLRFEIGDMYDPYSSMRADPLGIKVYYESLAASKQYQVERNYRPLAEFAPTNQLTLLAWGVSPSRIPGSKARALALYTFLRRGGRLVVGYEPQSWATTRFLQEEDENEQASTNDTTEADVVETNDVVCCSLEGDGTNVYRAPITRWWGASIGYMDASNQPAVLNEAYAGPSLPREISCHTTLVFTNLDEHWSVVYTCGGHPVVIERRIGDGTLLVSALSYFLSNEAMRNERHTPLLTWLAGTLPRIVFDESLHDVIESKGLAQLVRGYRLHLFFGMLGLLVVFFIWQRSVPLTPPFTDADEAAGVATAHGRDSLAGLVNLLRRNVSRKELLEICIAEWEKTARRAPADHEARAACLREIARTTKNPRGDKMGLPERYRRMSAAMEHFKKQRHTGTSTS
ncbi:MAG: DUF4350 domain-containing protein [Spartobacteria bacterium]|nr:DUF4350 domain-containing protein [Spartobacteria bacterium]